jgi:chromosome partitioning protein
MTYIVGMVSQKGGVGKSTLARMMAREFVAGGLSTKIADLDTQQQTCTHWAGRRAEGNINPEIQVQSFGSVKTALGEASRFDALILDGKPNASEQTIEIGQAADLVVIPTGQTVDDLHPGVVLAHSLRKKGIVADGIVFALFRTIKSSGSYMTTCMQACFTLRRTSALHAIKLVSCADSIWRVKR